MGEKLNTLYYALDLDDVLMQKKLEKDINDLSRLDDEFNKINATISKTFGQKLNVPIHNDIKQLVGELKTLASEWDALNIAQKRGVEGGNITSNYEKLSLKVNELGKSLATLYNESIRNAKAQERLAAAQEKAERGAMDKYYASLAKEQASFTKAQEKAIIASEKLAAAQEKQRSKQRAGEFKEYIQSLTKQSDISKQMSAYYKSLERQTAKAAAEQEKMANAQKRVANEVRKVNGEFTLQNRLLSNLKTLFTTYISIFAVKSFIQSLAQVRGEFENQQIALRAILRDAEAADKLFGQIKSFAVVSPFEFKDLVGYAKQLSAFQVPVNELFETTKRLADVSAGLGVGMDRIILAYGQVRSAAVLRGQELRQFTEAGIPLVDELAKKFSELEGRVVSAGDVFEKISNRMVSFEMVKEIFEDMTNEGGMFYMMQEKQAESLKGKIANLADAYDIMLNDIGEANDGILKGGVEGIAALFSNWEKVWSILKTLILGYGAYKTAIILATVAEKAHIALGTSGSLLKTAKNLIFVIQNLREYRTALEATGMSARTFGAALGGVIGILAAIGVAIYEVIQNSNKLSNDLNKISSDEFSGFRKMSDSLENLAEKLKNTVQGSQEHRDIIRQINNAYGEYLPFVLNEKTALDAVANSTEQVIEAMKKRKMMMAQQKGEEAIQNEYGDENTKAKKDLLDALSVVTNSRKDAEAIIQIVTQKIDELGTEVKIFEELQKAFTDYYEGAAPKELKIFDVYESVNDLQEITLNIKKAEEELAEQNRITWGSSFRTQKAREELEKLEASFEAMRKKIRLEGDTLDSNVKNAIDEINKNEKIAKIRWRVEFDGLGQVEADRLIYQIEHPLSKVIEEVNKELTNQIKDQKELDFIKIKDPGKSLDEIKQETITQFQSAQKILDGLLKTRKQWEGNKSVLDSMKKDIEQTQRQIELYKERARLLGITDKLQKDSDKGKDPNAERLKEQIDLIKKAQAQYEKYLQIMSPDEATSKIKNEKEFERFILPFNPNTVADQLQSIYDALSGTSGVQKLKNELIEVGKVMNETFGSGNVDLLTRPMIDAAKLTAKGWEDAGEGIATVFSSAMGVEQNGEEVMIHITPILPNGDVLSEDELNDYIDSVLNGVQNILEADSQKNGGLGIVLNVDSDTNIERASKWGDELHLIQEKYYNIKQQILDIDNLSKGSPLGDIIGKISKDGKDKIKKIIEGDLASINYTEAKKNFDRFLTDLTQELDSYKNKYNFYEQLLGITGDQDLAVNLAFNGNFEKAGEGIVEQIQQGMLKAASGTGLTLDQIMNLDFSKSADELGISEELKKFLQKSVDEIGKIQVGNILDFQKLIAEYSSVEDKIKAIQNKGNAERAKINETYARQRIDVDIETYTELEEQELAAMNASKQREDEAIRGLMSEMLQLTPFWQKLFGDLDELGYRSLTKLSDKAKEVLESAKVNKDKDGKVLGYTVEYDKKSYDVSVELFEKLRKQSNSLDKDLKKSNPFKTLFEALKEGPKDGEDFFDFATRVTGSLNGIIGIATEVGSSLSEMFGAIGNDKAAEAIDFSLQLGEALGNMLTDLSSGNPVQMVTGMVKGVAKIVTLFSQKHDNKLEKQIQESALAVQKLQGVYSELERMISRSLGGAENLDLGIEYTPERLAEINNQLDTLRAKSKNNILFRIIYSSNIKELEKEQRKLQAYEEGGVYAVQRENLIRQQEELIKQRQAEIDKKKTDQSKVLDYENQIKELDDTIRHFAEDTLKNLYDIDLKDWASQIGDSLVDAFSRGEDAAAAFDSTISDLMRNVTKKMVSLNILEPMFEKLRTYLFGSDGKSGAFGGDFKLNTEEVAGMKSYIDEIKNKGIPASQELYDAINKALGGIMDLGAESGGSFGKDIKGVTENTANLLGSYINAIRSSAALQEVYQKNIATNVSGIYRTIGGSPNITTTIPPEIMVAISEPFKLNNSLLASIDANMNNVHSIAANALAQLVMIQANTYNTAMATRDTVEELRGVISPGHPKGGSGIKVLI